MFRWDLLSHTVPNVYPLNKVKERINFAFNQLTINIPNFIFIEGIRKNDGIRQINIQFDWLENYPKSCAMFIARNGINHIVLDKRVRWGITWWQRNFDSEASFATNIWHEFGHVIGLNHSSSDTSIMNEVAFPREKLTQEDINLFKTKT